MFENMSVALLSRAQNTYFDKWGARTIKDSEKRPDKQGTRHIQKLTCRSTANFVSAFD